MRLYLSSASLGNQPECLSSLVGSNRRAAVIPNASVAATGRADDEVTALAGLGLVAEELDLRHFHSADELGTVLASFGLVWVIGGNSFQLRHAMCQSGFDDAIRPLLEQNCITYAGYSAGSVVATPTLRGIELVDDPAVAADDETVWQGLSLVSFSIAPHYRSGHPESAAIETVVRYWRDHDMPFRTLRDGQALVVDGSRMELVG